MFLVTNDFSAADLVHADFRKTLKNAGAKNRVHYKKVYDRELSLHQDLQVKQVDRLATRIISQQKF